MDKLYTIRNLSTSYGNNITLNEITLDIPSGVLVSLIGPNGSGKTTLLRVLSGLKGYKGSVILDGHEVKKISRRKFARYAGVVMSDKNFRPSYSFSVREIIAMGRLPYRGIFSRLNHNDNEIIEHSAELMNITHLMNRDITSLSDGERQLTFIASALAQETKILLLDEPTSSLDPDKSSRVFSLMKKLSREGRTIIAAVHDINSSMSYSDYYTALRGGRLISHGQELNEDILNELYGTKFTAYYNQERNDTLWRALPE